MRCPLRHAARVQLYMCMRILGIYICTYVNHTQWHGVMSSLTCNALLPYICVSVGAIEILGTTLEEACLKKGIIFSADLHTMYFVR
jgi:hypothetical protein